MHMNGWLAALIAIVSSIAAPAFAAPCKTAGTATAPIEFPAKQPSDVDFARSMVPVMLPDVSSALPTALTCTRSTVSTKLGDYAIGGENGDAFARMALRIDGKAGPIVYLAASPKAPGTFALVVHTESLTTVKRFYSGIPTDQRLADDVRAALADDTGVMRFEAAQRMVRYAFVPVDGIPPPAPRGRADGSGAGPQIMVYSTGDPALLDMGTNIRHKPSGFACPQDFKGLPVLLMGIDPKADYLACNYRAGTGLAYNPDEAIRYQIVLAKAPGQTPRSVFDDLVKGGRASLKITGDRTPPLATGPAPAPQFVAFWNTEGDGVQGVWVGQAGDWIIWVRAQYPPSATNDAEAGKVVGILFAEAAKQVK